eukprot:scaffold217499_cov49-Attheya_sp.AAC.4
MVFDIANYVRQLLQNDPGLWELCRDDTLNLNWNQFDRVGAVAIASALKVNVSLKQLFLDGNDISIEGAVEIASALKTNSTLRILSLNWSNIGRQGSKAIALALEENSSLEQLYLEGNWIGVDGAVAISSALKKNSTLLTPLSLISNNIQYRGSIAISSALKMEQWQWHVLAIEGNSTLQILHLSSNEVGHKGAVAFVRAFRSGHPIAILNVDFISVWEEKLISKCRELNKEQVVKKIICNEIPDVLFPQVVARLSIKQQHPNKVFPVSRIFRNNKRRPNNRTY